VSEITPIVPNLPLTGVAKVERDKKRKNPPPKPATQSPQLPSPHEGQPAQHIDEIV